MSILHWLSPNIFTPLGLSPLVYYDNDPVYMVSDGSSWIDRIGGNNLSASGTAKPTYTSNVLNSRSSFVFDGVNNALTHSRIIGMQGVSGLTLWAVGKRYSVVQDDGLASWVNATGVRHFSNDNIFSILAAGSQTFGNGFPVPNGNVFNYSIIVYDGTQSGNSGRLRLYVDGVIRNITYVGTIPALTENNSSVTFKVGAFSNTFLAGQSLEQGVVARTITDGEITSLSNYLANRYALPSPIGSIYSKSTFPDLSDWTNNGSTVSVVSNTLSFSGGAGTFTQTLDLTNYSTKLERWSITARFTVGTKNGSSFGFGVGIRSQNSYGLVDVSSRFLMYTGVGSGTLILNGDTSHVALGAPSSALTFSAGDDIELTLSLNDGVLVTAARNMTTDPTTSVTTNFTYGSGSPFMPNTGRFCIYSIGGSFTCTAYSITSNEYYKPDLLFLGDSKTQRYNASTYTNSFVSLYRTNTPSKTKGVVNYGGGYNRTQDYLNSLPEIINIIKPTRVCICGASNDVRSGVPDATMKANYASIVTQLIAAGIDVVHTTGLYETAISQTSLQAYIIANYPSGKIIDSVNTVIALSGDNIHPTDAGHSTFYNLLSSSGKL